MDPIHLQLDQASNQIIIESPASIVALIYSERCPHCPSVAKLMMECKKFSDCNFYLLDAETNQYVSKLTETVPTLIGFKNRVPIGKFDGPYSVEGILEFWDKVVNFNFDTTQSTSQVTDKETPKSNMGDIIVCRSDTLDEYKVLQV